MGEDKGKQREVRFLHFTQTSKLSTLVGVAKLCKYNVIFRAITPKAIQRDTLKNTISKSMEF